MNNIYLTSIESNTQMLDGGAMFGNAPKALWSRWTDVDEDNRIPLACRSLLIEVNDTKILCEVGVGNYFQPDLAKRFGIQSPQENILISNLKESNISPEEIDFVILSHLHFDHAGGLMPSYNQSEKTLNFPNAQYIVSKDAWERSNNPHARDKASFMPELNKLLIESNRLKIAEDFKFPTEINHLISFRQSNGHTPGQLHLLIRGKSQTVFFCGDLIPGTPWCHVPITMGYDRYPEKIIDEKHEVYQKAIPENWLMFYTHDSKVAASKLIYNEKNKVIPTEQLRSLTKFKI
ncbi:MAG: MBL fold metallo-hydrolase [Bdellovibrionales bacterium]|nr:MBL fold metallo-hydrolase [Bdellovibrionales bacterium]